MEKSELSGKRVHIIGIKGSGCAALAELLVSKGCHVTGSDISEKFYTDELLTQLGLTYYEEFSKDHISEDIDLVIHSAAYNQQNVEMAEALARGLTIYSYPQALGLFSSDFPAAIAIAGVHGKTTTTALAGCLVKHLGLPYSVLVGSGVSVFDGKSTYYGGDEVFIAETCEYRRHFLNFKATHLLLTSVEIDHQDYFKSLDDIKEAFVSLAMQLPNHGTVVYCADDEGACDVLATVQGLRQDLHLIPYGFKATGSYKLESVTVADEQLHFKVAAYQEPFRLSVPGTHTALNSVGVIAVINSIQAQPLSFKAINDSFTLFKGSRRRAEIIGKSTNDILVMDDYAHHPTAIITTLKGFKEFYPHRRLVVSFMSHTYSRTVALLDEFAASLDGADVLVLHKIFSSARERYDGTVSGYTLYEKCLARRTSVYYEEEPLNAVPLLLSLLKPGDLFLTMGAGDNFPLGKAILNKLQ